MKNLFNIALVSLAVLILSGCGSNKKLHIPAGNGNLNQVKLEIKNGTDVNLLDAADQTALMYASEKGQIDVVKYLVENGADVNIKGNKRSRGTALIYASAANRGMVVKYLLQNGALINDTTYNDETALHWASALGHSSIVRTLLKNKIDRTIKNHKGKTALDLAKNAKRVEVVTIFREIKK